MLRMGGRSWEVSDGGSAIKSTRGTRWRAMANMMIMIRLVIRPSDLFGSYSSAFDMPRRQRMPQHPLDALSYRHIFP